MEDVKLKEVGNDLFKALAFEQAKKCYTKAIQVNKAAAASDKDTDAGSRQAVYFSNRSGCFFELGMYSEATTDAQACLDILDRIDSKDTDETLRGKNLWRKARAFFYDSMLEESRDTLIALENCKDSDYSKKASKMLRQLDYYDETITTISKEKSEFKPCILRPKLQDPYSEYYRFGHDESSSLLCSQSNEIKDITLSHLSSDTRKSLAFLFGGVGDGRHVLATILDIHQQWKHELTAKQRKELHAHLTMNDINVHCLAKNILVFTLMAEIGAAESVEQASGIRHLALRGLVLQYCQLGYVMPACVHAEFQTVVKELYMESTYGVFVQTYPWIYVTPQDWAKLVDVASYWVNEDKYTPKLPRVSHTLKLLHPIQPRGDEDSQQADIGMSVEDQKRMDEMWNTRAADARNSMLAQVQDTTKWAEDSRAGYKEILQTPNATDAELSMAMVEWTMQLDDNDLLLTFGQSNETVQVDRLFLRETGGAVMPPLRSAVEELNRGMEVLAAEVENGNDDDGLVHTIEEFKDTINSTWKTNPAYFDPYYRAYTEGLEETNRFNPVTEWMDHYYAPFVAMVGTPSVENPMTGLAGCTFRFYWTNGRALLDLGKNQNLKLEISVDGITELGRAMQDESAYRLAESLATKFHRMTLSNIPDYIGLLSIFTEVAPLLYTAKDGDLVPSFRSNCLLNCSLWKSYDCYLLSTVALARDQVVRILGLDTDTNNPSVWLHFISWTQAGKSNMVPVSQIELKTWLHRLYLEVVLPPMRSAEARLREERPNNVDMFLRVCTFCIDVLKYPTHWICSVLEDLLAASSSSSPLKTRAALPQECAPIPIELRVQKYDISAFHLELSNRVTMWLQQHSCRIMPLVSCLPTGSAVRFCVKVPGLSVKTFNGFSDGNPSSNNLGFMLESKPDPKFDNPLGSLDPRMDMMNAMMGKHVPAKPPKANLRKELLGKGSRVAHVFSCVEWDFSKGEASFWMCDDVFEENKAMYFSLIRTDGWFRLGKGVQLGKAERIS